jgi:hypothetical protein
MKTLYFMFAVLTLPVMAFAEAGDTMSNQTSLKQPVTRSKKCEDGTTGKCVQKARKRSIEMKHNDLDRNEHAEGVSGAKES